jgi:hypothetical protein
MRCTVSALSLCLALALAVSVTVAAATNANAANTAATTAKATTKPHADCDGWEAAWRRRGAFSSYISDLNLNNNDESNKQSIHNDDSNLETNFEWALRLYRAMVCSTTEGRRSNFRIDDDAGGPAHNAALLRAASFLRASDAAKQWSVFATR